MEEAPKSKEQIMAELVDLKRKIYEDETKYESMVEFGIELRNKYPDCEEYELFHFLVGSSIREGHEPAHFDFPGEDSIETFLRRQE